MKKKKQETTATAYRPFVEQWKEIDWWSTLFSLKVPFELLHAGIADIKFQAKSAVAPRYCLHFADFFTSKIYTQRMKK